MTYSRLHPVSRVYLGLRVREAYPYGPAWHPTQLDLAISAWNVNFWLSISSFFERAEGLGSTKATPKKMWVLDMPLGVIQEHTSYISVLKCHLRLLPKNLLLWTLCSHRALDFYERSSPSSLDPTVHSFSVSNFLMVLAKSPALLK